MTIGVVIADDQALLRRGFRMLVESEPDMTVLGEAADGAEAIEASRRLQPDVVLMDIRMPGVNGVEATGRIKDDPRTAGARVLILTTFDLDEYVYGALRAGASGFVLKEISPEDLLDAIRVVAAGDALLAPVITKRLIERFTEQSEPQIRQVSPSLEILTEREKQVLSEVARGLTNAEIAEKLYISPGTAKTHVSRLLTKLCRRDRTQLVVFAFESGLVPIRRSGIETQPDQSRQS